ncbi:hypothetical protein SISNIDRAFT_458869 [Sistotremastrum niveocremeum HHB9708]|uniref:Uncharacterized protein n=1 Tax=Sistotremastrum niveocremeum HHB9708 TaxID=1314777 RepID=A0A164Q6B6_9AGAM|nr:hypothetical protein SISNIDRAFT_458869 [Sistotremastrum niveocremeum HHB9708]
MNPEIINDSSAYGTAGLRQLKPCSDSATLVTSHPSMSPEKLAQQSNETSLVQVSRYRKSSMLLSPHWLAARSILYSGVVPGLFFGALAMALVIISRKRSALVPHTTTQKATDVLKASTKNLPSLPDTSIESRKWCEGVILDDDVFPACPIAIDIVGHDVRYPSTDSLDAFPHSSLSHLPSTESLDNTPEESHPSDSADRIRLTEIMALRTEIELLQDDKIALNARLEQACREAHEMALTIQDLKVENEGLYESVDKAAKALEHLEKDSDKRDRFYESQLAQKDALVHPRSERRLSSPGEGMVRNPYKTPESIFRRKLHPPGSANVPLVILTSSTTQPQILSPAPSSSSFSPVDALNSSMDYFAPPIIRKGESIFQIYDQSSSPVPSHRR